MSDATVLGAVATTLFSAAAFCAAYVACGWLRRQYRVWKVGRRFVDNCEGSVERAHAAMDEGERTGKELVSRIEEARQQAVTAFEKWKAEREDGDEDDRPKIH